MEVLLKMCSSSLLNYIYRTMGQYDKLFNVAVIIYVAYI